VSEIEFGLIHGDRKEGESGPYASGLPAQAN